MPIDVRPARPEDIDACAGLLAQLFSQEHEFVPEASLQLEGLSMIVGNPESGTIFVCDKDGVVIGMVSLLLTVSTALGRKVALLEDMVVAKDSRGQGIGSRLLDHAIDWAAHQGLGRITLLTDHDNLRAQHFYESRGFSRSTMVAFRKPLEIRPAVPDAVKRPESSPDPLSAWICAECGYVYDPAEGDPEWNIRPGLPFSSLPDYWCCPVCNAGREQFRPFTSQL